MSKILDHFQKEWYFTTNYVLYLLHLFWWLNIKDCTLIILCDLFKQGASSKERTPKRFCRIIIGKVLSDHANNWSSPKTWLQFFPNSGFRFQAASYRIFPKMFQQKCNDCCTSWVKKNWKLISYRTS